MRRIVAWTGALSVVGALLAAPAAGGASWAIEPASMPSGLAQELTVPLDAVSCPAMGTCIAVGGFQDDAGQPTAAEVWNGSTWSPQRVPVPGVGAGELRGVSCVSTSMCMAVGYVTDGLNATSFAEVWNGLVWTPEPVRSPPGYGGQLSGVSCAARTSCMAVGEYLDSNGNGFPYAEAWNGTTWSRQRAPVPHGSDGTLVSVWCTSATSCQAVGNYIESDGDGDEWALADRWDGSVWSESTVPLPPGAGALPPTSGDPAGDLNENSLNAVTCRSATDCVAVGGTDYAGGGTITAAWNGTSWTLRPVPASGVTLTAVSCTSPTACVAFGSSETAAAALVFKGTTWSVLQTAKAPLNELTYTSGAGVSCTAADSCIGVLEPFAEAWDGSVWTLHTPQIVEPATSAFDAVSCTSATACTAVGSYGGVLVERWDGRRWALQRAPNPAEAVVKAVSCASATACMLVGAAGPGVLNTPNGGLLAERWDGTGWSITPTPRARGEAFDAVSCTSASACIAVGGNISLLAARWDGRRWSLLRVPLPPSDQDDAGALLSGVSCSSPDRCTAIGTSQHNFQTGDGGLGTENYTVAERWDGRRWLPERPSQAAGLSALSCPSATSCNAITQEWDGARWSVGPSPHAHLGSVSCAAPKACTGVGNGHIERWDGTDWASQPAAPNVAHATFRAVSCPSAQACVMVGAGVGSAGVSVPLVERYS
jgi:hypothetical protein